MHSVAACIVRQRLHQSVLFFVCQVAQPAARLSQGLQLGHRVRLGLSIPLRDVEHSPQEGKFPIDRSRCNRASLVVRYTFQTLNPDAVSAFAAQRSSDSALTIMVVAKVLTGSTAATVNLANFVPGAAAQVWQLTSANSINRLADVPISGSSLSVSLPAQSITLFVIPTAGGAALPSAPKNVRITGSSSTP